MTQPSIAVIIPTINREKPLVAAIKSVLAAEYPSHLRQLIVIDQTETHTPEVQAFLEEHEKKGLLTWLRPPAVAFRSLTKARNLGIRTAKNAEILIFIDDDVTFESSFLQAHVETYANPEIGAVAGRIRVPGHSYPDENPQVIADVTFFGAFVNNFYGTEEKDCRGFVGCNFSLRQTIAEEAGYFDEAFVGNAMREDTDMAMRIVKTGALIRFQPKAFVIHHMEAQGGTRSAASKLSWYQAFFFNHALFYAKHAGKWRRPFFTIHLWRPILVCWLYYGKGSPSYLGTVVSALRNGYTAGEQSNFQPQ